MAIITFNKAEKNLVIQKIQTYFTDKLNQEIGQFDAEFLLDFFANEIGPHFYNKALEDSQTILQKRIDEILGSIESLEKPLAIQRKPE